MQNEISFEPIRPRAGETLWEVRQEHHTWSAHLSSRGEYGVEAQIMRDGELVIAYLFNARAEAVAWTEDERERRERGDSPDS